MMQTFPSRRWRAALAILLTALLAAPSTAGTGGSNSNSPSGSTLVGGGDDVVGLPVMADTTGITFVGDWRELRSIGLSVRGEGRIDVIQLPRGGVALTFVGNYRIELDRSALARSSIAVLVRDGLAFSGGYAALQVGDSLSAFTTDSRIALPLSRLAETPRVQGEFLTLDVLGTTGHRAHLVADFAADRIALTQRMR